jgi:molybdopterin-containing oxidoreductase family membrane subunit
MAKKLAVVGIFAYLNEVVAAIEGLRKQKVPIEAVYSPMRTEEIREALGEPLLGPGRFYTLTGGILGVLIGISLAWYTAAQWRFIVGGKPPIPVIPAVIPGFEFLILIAVFFTLGGLLFLNRMPKMRLPPHYDKRFSQDRFGILVYCAEADIEPVSSILKNLGAEEVRQIED